ncbi:hypothetical protein GYB14_14150 [bacterium]|nr:hypothetical protein [bacterium]
MASPSHLFTAAQSAFTDTAHIDFRSNWEVDGSGRLSCTGGNAGQAARLSLDAALTPSRAHFIHFDHAPEAGSLRARFASPGITNSRQLTVPYMDFEYIPAAEVTDAATRLDLQPSTDYAGVVDNIVAYDLSTVDPNDVPCYVLLVGGDSNSANATSERFGTEPGDIPTSARETPFDPGIWYLPLLLATGSFPTTDSTRHVPQPCIEPVAAVEARRMSPVHAVAGELVEWCKARGRPLLVMALGDPGSGLLGSKGVWTKGLTPDPGQPQMFDEMMAMKAAVEALGPAHEIIGAVWSMGANDLTGAGYTAPGQWVDQMVDFVADVRADLADVPMVLWSVGQHYEPSPYDGRGAAMLSAQLLLDKDSGDARAIDRFSVVTPETGNELSNADDPHYDAHGMQQNGRDAGQALLSLLA